MPAVTFDYAFNEHVVRALSPMTSVITEPGRMIFHFLNHAQDRLRVHHIVICRLLASALDVEFQALTDLSDCTIQIGVNHYVWRF